MELEPEVAHWETLARQDPLWAVYVAPGTKGGAWDLEAFAATGRAEVDRVMARVDELNPGLDHKRALDFGCGVGRLTAALARHFTTVVGVDASPTMLERARELDLAEGRAEFVLNQQHDLRSIPTDSIDLAYSSLVLQHLPRAAAMGYVRELLRVTKPSGIVVVQVTTSPLWSVKGIVFRCAPPSLIGWAQRWFFGYPAPMRMTALPVRLMRSTVADAGAAILAVEDDDSYGGHWRYTRYYLHACAGKALADTSAHTDMAVGISNDAEPPAGFDKAWRLAESVKGWMTRQQGRALWCAADSLTPGATVVEIGSHQGRSTIILAAAASRSRASVVAVDPFVEGRLFGGQSTRDLFERNIDASGLAQHVRLEAEYSHRLLARWNEPVELLYIDGKHDYWSCTRDLGWVAHMTEGSQIFVHDAFSSIGVTLCLFREASRPTSRLCYQSRTGSLAEFVVGSPTRHDRLGMCREIPWFFRNVGIKVLLRLRLNGVARALGHDSPYDPY